MSKDRGNFAIQQRERSMYVPLYDCVQVCSWTIRSFKKLFSLLIWSVLLYILLWEFWKSDDGFFELIFLRHLFLELEGSSSCMPCGNVTRNTDKEGAEQDCIWYSVISDDVKPCQPISKLQAGHLKWTFASVCFQCLGKHVKLWSSTWTQLFLSELCNLAAVTGGTHQAGENTLPVSFPTCIYLSAPMVVYIPPTHTCGDVTSESHSGL